ncbi:MAG: NAD(P)-binding domain-containing protein [Synergistaceae bacterium]|nr:NAD(P)-binding domain-containing protein [Synergistaceae bacterium]
MDNIKTTRVSIIGAGALGGAVAKGLTKAGCSSVVATDAHPERLEELGIKGVRISSDNAEAIAESEVVMFALKPHITLGVVKEHASLLRGKLCISLAAAVTLDMLKQAAPDARWMRGMSNLCAELNCAFTGIVKSDTATDADLVWMIDTFGLLGEVEVIEEKSIDAITALAASAPAFFVTLMEALAMGGIYTGLPKDLAYRGAMSAMLGAARLSMASGKHPATLRDDVCTPAGVTIEGIYEIERAGARATLMKAIILTADKVKVLTEKITESQKQ